MNGSASLLDYGLIDAGNVSNITSFVIDEQARYACGSDHALLECELQYSAKRVIKWKFREGAINMSRGGVPIIILNSDRSTGSP